MMQRAPQHRRDHARPAVLLMTLGTLLASLGCEGALETARQAEEARPPARTSPEPGAPQTPGTPGTPTPPTQSEPPPPFAPGPAVLPRLTERQYRNALRDVFGAGMPLTQLEQDTNPYLFTSIGASTTQLSAYGVEQYDRSANAVARRVVASPGAYEALLGCATQPDQLADAACLRTLAARLGRRLFRRPLSEEELTRWTTLALETRLPERPYSGLESLISAMLQSPNFLYHVQLGEPDSSSDTTRYTSYEMADRLAALLWDTIPDEALLDAAERGELLDDRQLEAHARRMIDDERARDATLAFFSQYLDLKKLEDVWRDPQDYPAFSPELIEAMRVETLLLVDEVVFERDQDVRALFSTRRTHVNDALAALYGVEAPGASPYAFVPVELPAASKRSAGLLTLSAFLAMNAHPAETSPTLRGKYLRERIFCETVPPPPANASLELPQEEESGPRTLRERLEAHRSTPQCAGCHAFIDPPGYLFEQFDALGRYRERDQHDLVLDPSGSLDGTPMQDSSELGELLASNEKITACLVKQLYRHASGRLDTPGERAALEELELAFALSGYRFKELLVALVLSEGFRTVSQTSAQGE